MKSKIFIGLLLVIFVALVIWGYLIFSERHDVDIKAEPKLENTTENKKNNDEVFDGEPHENENIEGEIIPEKEFTSIDRDLDCESECEKFQEDEKEYCQQVCGLLGIQEISDGCTNLEGIEKDYCLKDSAVAEKNFKTCDEIWDTNIKVTCTNRVAEEIIDEQQQSDLEN